MWRGIVAAAPSVWKTPASRHLLITKRRSLRDSMLTRRLLANRHVLARLRSTAIQPSAAPATPHEILVFQHPQVASFSAKKEAEKLHILLDSPAATAEPIGHGVKVAQSGQ